MIDRHQFRADWHSYNEGIYFVTICCANRKHYFGEISNGQIHLTKIGEILKSALEQISNHFQEAELLNHVIMPNHLHLIVATRHGASSPAKGNQNAILTAKGDIGCLRPKRHDAIPDQDFHHNSRLAIIIGQLKSTVKREANKRSIPFEWQPRFHEHIIRDQAAFDNIMNYIDTNIENWHFDSLNRAHIANADAPWRRPYPNPQKNASR